MSKRYFQVLGYVEVEDEGGFEDGGQETFWVASKVEEPLHKWWTDYLEVTEHEYRARTGGFKFILTPEGGV